MCPSVELIKGKLLSIELTQESADELIEIIRSRVRLDNETLHQASVQGYVVASSGVELKIEDGMVKQVGPTAPPISIMPGWYCTKPIRQLMTIISREDDGRYQVGLSPNNSIHGVPDVSVGDVAILNVGDIVQVEFDSSRTPSAVIVGRHDSNRAASAADDGPAPHIVTG